MVILKIWHVVNHNDFTVTEFQAKNREIQVERIRRIKEAGFFAIPENDGLVPWHRINYFEIVEGENEEWCGAGEKGGRQ